MNDLQRRIQGLRTEADRLTQQLAHVRHEADRLSENFFGAVQALIVLEEGARRAEEQARQIRDRTAEEIK